MPVNRTTLAPVAARVRGPTAVTAFEADLKALSCPAAEAQVPCKSLPNLVIGQSVCHQSGNLALACGQRVGHRIARGRQRGREGLAQRQRMFEPRLHFHVHQFGNGDVQMLQRLRPSSAIRVREQQLGKMQVRQRQFGTEADSTCRLQRLRVVGASSRTASCRAPKDFTGEVVSDLRQREEGVRIKHRLNDNSVKLYDKAFTELVCLMRAEATFNSVNDFRVYRPKEGDPKGELAWRPLRRGIADLHRRAEVSRKATERYLDALASIDEDTTLDDVLHRLGQPTYWHGRRVCALQPFAPDDRQLIQAISRGEFTINGVRNRDLQRLYFAQSATTPAEARRR